MRQDSAGKWLDLAERGRRPPERMPGDSRGFDARTDGEVAEAHGTKCTKERNGNGSKRVDVGKSPGGV